MNDFPVVFGICLDAEAAWLTRGLENANKPVLLSNGTYGVREGLDPLLALLTENGIRTTFFVPGMTADRYPEAVQRIHAAGHEIGAHGYGHRALHLLTPLEEREELVGGMDSLEAITGTRPAAWRAPGWEWTDRTLQLLLDHGITISTNFHDRSRPYRHERDGKPLPLIELPVQWHLADTPFFLYGGQIGRTVRPASEAEEIWREEFDGLYERPGAFYHLTLHVEQIGHPGRLRMLARHIQHIRKHGRVRFMTSSECAATVP